MASHRVLTWRTEAMPLKPTRFARIRIRDQSTSVGYVVWRVHDPLLGDAITAGWISELIVGGAADDLAAQLGKCRRVHDRP